MPKYPIYSGTVISKCCDLINRSGPVFLRHTAYIYKYISGPSLTVFELLWIIILHNHNIYTSNLIKECIRLSFAKITFSGT